MPPSDSNSNANGWNEYSKLVLKELESLAGGIENLNNQMHDMKTQLTEFKSREDRVEELRAWKGKIDDVVSPPQLKEVLLKVESLETFKTRAIGIFAAVQFTMAVIVFVFNLMK